MILRQSFLDRVPGPAAASTSPGNLLDIQILWPHLRSTESEMLRMGPAQCLPGPPGDYGVFCTLRTTSIKQYLWKAAVAKLTSLFATPVLPLHYYLFKEFSLKMNLF